MTVKQFKEAAKFTIEKKGNIYFFIGVLCSEIGIPYGDKEWEDLFKKMIKNEND